MRHKGLCLLLQAHPTLAPPLSLKEVALKFCFCVFWKGPTFPALLQFSLNTTVIGLISYLLPGSGSEEGRGGGRQKGPGPRQAVGMLQ